MRDQFIETFTLACESNRDLVLITGDLGFGVLNNFIQYYPEQFVNAGVAEQNMTGIATGLGLNGKNVFTYSIGNFCTLRCLEQIRNDACYHEANVTIVAVGGGFSYGSLGYSHHATEDISIMRALPNIRVFAPGDLFETQKITEFLVNSKGVNYLRLDKSWPKVNSEAQIEFSIGKARKHRSGNDFSIFVTGGILEVALEASYFLKDNYDLRVSVYSFHTLKPIDKEVVIESVESSGGILTLEEHSITGGLGSIIAEVLCDELVLPKHFIKIGLSAGFSSIVGSQRFLRTKYGMDKDSVVRAILKSLDLVP